MVSKKDSELLEKIREDCPTCKGKGFVLKQFAIGLVPVDCDCTQKISKEISLIRANIPLQYRYFTMRNLTKEFEQKNEDSLAQVKKFKAEITTNIEKGNGLWFVSSPGQAKSSLISVLLKAAISAGKTVYFERASHLLRYKFDALRDMNARGIIDFIVNDVDILAIEELEKVYLLSEDSFANNLFYEFLSDLYDSKKSLLVSSNLRRQEVLNRFPAHVQDRLYNLTMIPLSGNQSGRRLKNEKENEEPVEKEKEEPVEVHEKENEEPVEDHINSNS